MPKAITCPAETGRMVISLALKSQGSLAIKIKKTIKNFKITVYKYVFYKFNK